MADPNSTKATYEKYWAAFQESAQYHPANRFRYKLVVSILRRYLRPGMTVVDMGCGDANLLWFLKQRCRGPVYYGCDVSHHVIELNRQQKSGIFFFQADVASPDFLSQAAAAGVAGCDIVVCSEVIEHVEEDQMVLNNAYGLLKPSGRLILTTQSGPRYRVDLELLHHLRHYDRRCLEQMVIQAGLAIIDSFNCGFPLLTLQKVLVDAVFDWVKRAVASSKRPTRLARGIMAGMYYAMLVSPRMFGPQLVLLGRKP